MKLYNFLSGKIPQLALKTNVPYRELTTLGVGSSLPLLAEPSSTEQLSSLLELLCKKSVPWFIFGAGSNVVGMDKPYSGVGIRLDSKAAPSTERA